MKKPLINKALAEKVLGVVDKGLVCGMGAPKPGAMCVEAAVCYAFGWKHGDDPPCVSNLVRNAKIGLNDMHTWTSNEARAVGLRRLSIAQLGSARTEYVENVLGDKILQRKGPAINERKFAESWFFLVLRKLVVPKLVDEIQHAGPEGRKVLRRAIRIIKSPTCTVKQVLTEYEELCSEDSVSLDNTNLYTLGDVHPDKPITIAVAADYLVNEEDGTISPKELSELCEGLVQILVKLKSPGTKFLYLAPLPKKGKKGARK